MKWMSAMVGVSLLMAGLGTASEAGTVASADGDGVFRPYGAPGGLKDEFEQLAAEHPDITKLVTIGQTVQGEDIVALKVSRHASRLRDGRRPATLFLGASTATSGSRRRWCGASPTTSSTATAPIR